MATNIQIRGVPVKLRDKLKRRARSEGKSMSQYLVELIERDLEKPTMREFMRRLRQREPMELDVPAAEIIREAREEREAELMRRIGRG